MQRVTNWARKIIGDVPFFQSPLFKPYTLLVLLAFIIGFILRIWDFGNLPPGLMQDEASIGVEAASLYHYGMDRNGESFPVHFIAWGSGQNALYAYFLIPFVPWGLSPLVIRLPMLIAGLFTMGIVYGIAKKVFSPSIALLSLFLIAISPWHISISRWALESNLFPFMFSLAFLCLVSVDRHPFYFLPAMGLLALSLYAYGTAYFFVPLFIFIAALFWLKKPNLTKSIFFLGIGIFILLSFPIFLFVLVNAFGWNEIHLGALTIPRMISDPRIIEMTGILSGANKWYYYDLLTTAKILFLQTDDLIYNFIPPYGFLFPGAILFSLMGAGLVAEKFWKERSFGPWAFGAWLFLAFLLGILIPPTVHRINIIFIPLILCAAVALDWILRDKKILVAPIVLGLAAYAILFWREYSGSEFRQKIGWEFNDGLIPAIQYAKEIPAAPICLTNEMSMPYIYVQLADFRNPMEYLVTMKYLDPVAKYRVVQKMGRYSFGIQNCVMNPQTIYILKSDQTLPVEENLFSTETFGNYVVYIPLKVE
jgi:hypothetical protein